MSAPDPPAETAAAEPAPFEAPAPRRRWTGIIAGVVLALIALHLLGVLRGIEGTVGEKLPDRPADALLGIVNVFTCCVLSWRALTTMLPAFVLGGAIAAFIPTTIILRYLGADANRFTAYAAAAFFSPLLSLCSCNIVPLFASIYRRGAGIGPAFTFLFAGPAINPIAIIFTVQVIGLRIGVWRALAVPVIAIATGLLMSLLFRGEEKRRAEAHREAHRARLTQPADDNRRLIPFFGLLLTLVIFGATETSWLVKGTGMGAILALLVMTTWRWFERDELRSWGHETWGLVRMVIPVLLPAILLIGAIAAYIDIKLVYQWVGEPPSGAGLWRSMQPIVLGDLFGAFMYFPILSEVAFTKAFLKLGMDVGPALAVLLTGSGLSLPGLFIIARAIGWRKALIYESIVVVITGGICFFFASAYGEYICECMMMSDAPAHSESGDGVSLVIAAVAGVAALGFGLCALVLKPRSE